MDDSIHQQVSEALQARIRGLPADLAIPPPVFLAMEGEFLKFDEPAKTLMTRFPVLAGLFGVWGWQPRGLR